jgi:hypothetical protein
VAATLCAASLAIAGCNSPNSPTEDPPPTSNPPTNPPPTNPPSNPTGALTVTINPNPVPHSGQPITDAAGCAGVRYTWFYDQVVQETGGAQVTITNRIDLFDDRETNNVGNLNIVVPANGTATVRSRWCSSTRAEHSSQTRFTGTDAAGRPVTVLGPRVRLMLP